MASEFSDTQQIRRKLIACLSKRELQTIVEKRLKANHLDLTNLQAYVLNNWALYANTVVDTVIRKAKRVSK